LFTSLQRAASEVFDSPPKNGFAEAQIASSLI